MTNSPVDPVALTQALIRCPSVTPEDAGALDHVEDVLAGAGFTCTRVDRGQTRNLFARWGERARRAVWASTAIPMWCPQAAPTNGGMDPLTA